MCLLACAYKVHPHWRLIVAGNRDEAYARAAEPLAVWTDAPQVMAGRDIRSHGTWMGVDQRGRVGVVTNVRDPQADMHKASRGALVADYLQQPQTAQSYGDALSARMPTYRPFNLLLFDAAHGMYLNNHPQACKRLLAPGIHALSNAHLDTPWPKTRRLQQIMREWCENAAAEDFTPLFAALADRHVHDDADLPDTGVGLALERRLSAAFIVGDEYGTRASTIIAVDYQGRGCVIEKRFGPHGTYLGETRLDFAANASD